MMGMLSIQERSGSHGLNVFSGQRLLNTAVHSLRGKFLGSLGKGLGGSGVVIANINREYQAGLRKSLPALKHKTIKQV